MAKINPTERSTAVQLSVDTFSKLSLCLFFLIVLEVRPHKWSIWDTAGEDDPRNSRMILFRYTVFLMKDKITFSRNICRHRVRDFASKRSGWLHGTLDPHLLLLFWHSFPRSWLASHPWPTCGFFSGTPAKEGWIQSHLLTSGSPWLIYNYLFVSVRITSSPIWVVVLSAEISLGPDQENLGIGLEIPEFLQPYTRQITERDLILARETSHETMGAFIAQGAYSFVTFLTGGIP